MRLVACVSQFEGPQSFIPAVRLYVDPLPSPMKVGITKLNRVSAKRYMAKVHGRLPTLPRKRRRQGVPSGHSDGRAAFSHSQVIG